ncbi:MAG: Brp/Blh family beta-carotene 15,15'-dioxygenase [Myxococcota bacterium]|nr:Brp/Blh family beta-carotene 15,15'-dioxygenase [Myxococcota bacterium]
MASRLNAAAGWHPRWARGHAVAFALLSLAAGTAGVATGASPSVESQLGLLVPAVLLLGVPHGAFDGELGRAVFSRRSGRRWLSLFLAFYLGLAAFVVLAWSLAPVATLGAFLAVSAFHFALCDHDPRLGPGVVGAIESAARGAAPVLLPVVFHTGDTAELFALLVPGTTSAELGAALRTTAPSLGLLLAAGLALGFGRHAWLAASRVEHVVPALEIAGVVLAGAALPPLLFFAVYFCIGHAPRHAFEIAAALDPVSARRALVEFAKGAAPLSVATWLLFGAACGIVSVDAVGVVELVRVLFIGLAALTLPHLALQLLLRLSLRGRTRATRFA